MRQVAGERPRGAALRLRLAQSSGVSSCYAHLGAGSGQRGGECVADAGAASGHDSSLVSPIDPHGRVSCAVRLGRAVAPRTHADSVASPAQNINSIVHPSEIEQLSDLQGYLNFAPPNGMLTTAHFHVIQEA